jgi:hypothetical protein
MQALLTLSPTDRLKSVRFHFVLPGLFLAIPKAINGVTRSLCDRAEIMDRCVLFFRRPAYRLTGPVPRHSVLMSHAGLRSALSGDEGLRSVLAT